MRIETERLLLRPFAPEDAPDLLAYLPRPAVHCFEEMKLSSMDDALRAAAERARDPELYLAIQLKQNGRVIGEIFSHAESTGPTQSAPDTYSPCWMLNEAYQGKGYMVEAARAYYDYLFGTLGACRIYLYTEDYNLSCQYAILKSEWLNAKNPG